MTDPWEKFIEGSLVEKFNEGFRSTAPKPPEEVVAPARNAESTAFEKFFGLSPSMPQQSSGRKVTHDFVVNGLVERGLPRNIAEGFALNIAEESGFDPGINEIEPLVPGSRGGFGLIQSTGLRRDQLEAAARARGVDPADPEFQLDRIVEELKTTERRAAEKIFAANTVGEAATAVVNDFLRPAEENRARRVAKFQSLGF